MTTTPASMGGPLSEAERTAEIQARVDNLAYHTPPWSVEHDCFGTDIHFGDHDQVNDADGDLVAATDYSEVANLLMNAAPDLEFLLSRVGVLEGQLATARALHQPERRYTPDGGESSYATFEEAADAHDGTFVEVTHFDVCSHCASMELGDGYTLDYRESLWPCKDAVALGLDGGGTDA